MSNEEKNSGKQGGQQEDHGKDIVTITVDDNTNVSIHRGAQTGTTIKEAAGLPAAYVLNEVVNNILKPIGDDQKVVIKGGEVFESHAPDGGSS